MAREPEEAAGYLRVMAALLAAIALLSAQWTLAEESNLIGLRLAAVAAAAFAAWMVSCSRFLRACPPRARSNCLLLSLSVLAVVPLLEEAIGAATGKPITPMEIILLACNRNMLIGFLVFSRWQNHMRQMALLSLFIMVVAAAVGRSNALGILTIAFVAAGGAWLMLDHWSSLRIQQPAATKAGPSSRTGAKWRRVAYPALIIGAVIAAAVLAGAALKSNALVARGEGFLPSSGGDKQPLDQARDGVGDGDAAASGSHPQSTGFSDSNIFLETKWKSLYDMQSDMYGTPREKADGADKAVSLNGKPVKLMKQKGYAPRSEQDSREFSLRRDTPPQKNKLSDRPADALMYIVGPVPLHVRLKTYDRFDGSAWHEASSDERRPCRLASDENKWMWLPRLACWSSLGAPVRHEIKIGLLETDRIPAPGLLESFRLGWVTRRDWFSWAEPDILKIVRNIPAGEVINTQSLAPRREQLLAISGSPSIGDELGWPMVGEVEVSEGIRALARDWTCSVPRGWLQVEAVVGRLRARCTLDPKYVVPATCMDPVGHFLFESRRGPDYQFATAAALMLRSLEYPARVVNGFYADPSHFDRRTGQTSIQPSDMHFWVELHAGHDAWITVEPSPGYGVLEAPLTPWERVCGKFSALARKVAEHGNAILAVCLVGAAVWLFRRCLLDRLLTLGWRLAPVRSQRSQVLAALRLLELRHGWAGRPRPANRTLYGWYSLMAKEAPAPHAEELSRFASLTSWAAYAPTGHAPSTPADDATMRRTCRNAVTYWSLHQIRIRSKRKESPSHAGEN